ncbi:hypothetical protein ACWCV9_31210 [Streptomyces sp. NPDC001606]
MKDISQGTSQGLPYEECRRQAEHAPPRDRTGPWPGYALPPFHPGYASAPSTPSTPPMPRTPTASRTRHETGVLALTLLCIAGLLCAILS